MANRTDNEMYVFVNGLLVPEAQAVISVFDMGFLYGDGVFETIRVYNWKPFRLKEHLSRLSDGLKVLRICSPLPDIEDGIKKVLRKNRIRNGSIRIEVTRGISGSGIDIAAARQPSIVISAKSGCPYNRMNYKMGFRAIISSIRKDAQSPISRIKSANYIPHILARADARDAGADEAIMLTHEGSVAEGTVSNLFLVKGSVLLTPSIESGILPGITRNAVIELARDMIGIHTMEGHITPSDIMQADEAFLTNSLMEIMPLVAIDGVPIGRGAPGKISLRLRRTFLETVKKEGEAAPKKQRKKVIPPGEGDQFFRIL